MIALLDAEEVKVIEIFHGKATVLQHREMFVVDVTKLDFVNGYTTNKEILKEIERGLSGTSMAVGVLERVLNYR